MKRVTSVATPVAHLVGPGKIKVVNQQLAFSCPGQGAIRLDPRTLKTICCYGNVTISDEAFRLIFRHGIAVAWLTPSGNRCHGRLVGCDPASASLRSLQHRALAQDQPALLWARYIVFAKIRSQIDAARRFQRNGCANAAQIISTLEPLLRQSASASSLDQVRGLEGAASAAWFRYLSTLFRPPWVFTQRLRRPPPDPVNALLSLGYTWITTRATAKSEAYGLEVYLGGLHDFRPGRPSLACDLVEPLRVPAVDRWVIALCNQNRVTPADFVSENGGVRLRPDVFGRVLSSWESHWVAGKHEKTLDALLTDFVNLVRHGRDPLAPNNGFSNGTLPAQDS